MFKKVIFNTGAQVVGKAITASITLLITVIIGKNLGPAGYGDFTKIFVFVGYFYTLADFGLNSIYIKIAKENEITHLKPLLGLRLLIGISLALVAVVASRFFPFDSTTATGFSPLVKTGIAIAALTIITQAIFTTTNAFFQKILRYDLSTISASLGYLAILTTAVVVTFSSKSLLGYTSAYVVGGIIFAAAAYFQVANRIKKFFTPTFKIREFSTFLKPAWPVGIALLFNLIYFRIDVLILSNFRSSTEVGLYGLAYQFFEAALAIPIFFSNAIYPPLANFYKVSRQRFQKEVKNWLFILSGVSVLLTIAMFSVSLFIPAIFGKNFEGSVPALQILSLGFPFFFISALLWHLLIIYDKQKYLTVIYAAGAIINIVANLIFIPSYGYIAASVITVVSEALITLL
ncbi:MAG: flippase, partial [Candidatus Curtissbacteria bacterium]|nr:flippase [Candidatus Curtissbacteria bacterium]